MKTGGSVFIEIWRRLYLFLVILMGFAAIVGSSDGGGGSSDNSEPVDSVVKWTLVDVAFDDGGIATGTFDIDMNTNVVVDWNVDTSGGNTTDFPEVEYGPTTSIASFGYYEFTDPRKLQFVIEYPSVSDVPQYRQVIMSPLNDLTSQGGTIKLDTEDDEYGDSYCGEGFNGPPFRRVVSGSVSTVDPGTGQFPNILGQYNGSYTIDVTDCMDPSDNGTYTADAVFNIMTQNQNSFSGAGTGTITKISETEKLILSGTITTTGEITGNTSQTSFDTTGQGTFTGQLTGNTLTITNNGSLTSGDTCTYQRNITVTR